MFLNSRGTPLGRSVDCVGSGQPVFLDLNGASIDGSTNRTEVRVAVRLQPPPEADRDQSNVVATVEVIDNQTGKTVVKVPAVQNQPPNDFAVAVSPRLGIAHRREFRGIHCAHCRDQRRCAVA